MIAVTAASMPRAHQSHTATLLDDAVKELILEAPLLDPTCARLASVAALWLAAAHWPAWLGLAAFAAHLGWQINRLELGNSPLCQKLFWSNREAGLLLFAGLLADALMRAT